MKLLSGLIRSVFVLAFVGLSTTASFAACWQWSLTASANGTADPSINFAEGMSPSSVNDSARAMMARLAECRDDLSGKLSSTGTSTAYAVTSNQGTIAATPGDGQQISFKPNATNGAAPTLAVDGGTAFPIQSSPGVAVASSTLVSGVPYRVTFSSGSSAWLLQDFFAITVNLDQFGSTRGSVLERGAGGWVAVVPGTAGTVWTSNGSGADPTYQSLAPIPPHGRITPSTGVPVINGDISAATRIYYLPSTATIPINNGSSFINTALAQLTLDLSAGSQSANGIFDIFISNQSSVAVAAFGPNWTAGGGSVSAGSGARGTGAGSTELQAVNGILTNKNAISAANNGATTYAISANQGTYVGSCAIDSSAGQVSWLLSYGQSRKIGCWTAYSWNRVPIILKAGAGSVSTTTTTSYLPFNNDSANSITVFSGLSEEAYEFEASFNANINTPAIASPGIGFNSTSVASGYVGVGNATSVSSTAPGIIARYSAPPSMGINVITSLMKVDSGTMTLAAGERGNLISAKWRY